jgi:hypothetical protein
MTLRGTSVHLVTVLHSQTVMHCHVMNSLCVIMLPHTVEKKKVSLKRARTYSREETGHVHIPGKKRISFAAHIDCQQNVRLVLHEGGES